MPSRYPQTVIVGAGIVGAAVAWRLARRGTDVTVVDRHPHAAGGVTRHSYGWIGTGSRLPTDDPMRSSIELQAIADFRSLERDLGTLPCAVTGALVWSKNETATAAFAEAQRVAGAHVDILPPTRIRTLEPHLHNIPPLAVWLPEDRAVEPVGLAKQLLLAAVEAGARIHYDTRVERIVDKRGRVAGLVTEWGTLPADVIVLANGMGAIPLVAAIGIALPLHTEPAVLLRFAAGLPGPRHLLYADGLELRPTLSGELVSAEGYPDDGEVGLAALATRTRERIAGLFGWRTQPVSSGVDVAFRPMTADGAPLCGFVDGLGGLYATIGHPGVMLAPSLRLRAAADILGA